MIKAMSFSSAVRTHCVCIWVSIFWPTSAAVLQFVELQTMSQVAAQCGENVTLMCDVSSSRDLDIRLFSWLVRNETVCEYERNQSDHQFRCEATKATNHRLTLTLINVMPVNEGKYICKLQSTQGAKSNTTFVTVQDCPGSSDSSMNKSDAKCSFSGVYPNGTVHWFQGDANLTGSASTQDKMDQHGLYNVWSTISVEKRNLSLPYNCSLWIPSRRKYHSWKLVPIVQEQDSSGSIVRLQWICIMVEIIMVNFMM